MYSTDFVPQGKRQRVIKRSAALKAELSSWLDQYRDISKHILPRTGRFLASDRNLGDKRHNSIYDSTGTKALRTLAAGMMAGMTSPARPWFRLATSDPGLMEIASVKRWLDDVTQLMRDIFARSNTYRALHATYLELGAYGTGATVIVPDFDNVLQHHPLTVGEYAIATDERGAVNTLMREYDMTVEQIIGQFVAKPFSRYDLDWSAVSPQIKNHWDRGDYNTWVTVTHLIEPRREREHGKRDGKNMPFKSCYIETNGTDDKYLRESGYKRFPALCPRWEASGGDVYGNGPGMDALGDIKQLQHEQLRKANAIDYQVKPPLNIPMALKNQQHSTLPGGASYVDPNQPNGKITSAFDVNLKLDHLLEDIRDVRQRIRSTFFADLFLFLSELDRGSRQITAREVAEIHEEKLLMLGPVTERQHNELLSPKIDITFDYIVEAGLLRGRLAPPPELREGAELNIEFVSMLAQAQRAVGLASVDRFLGTVIAVGQTQALAGQIPTVGDKVNGDQIIDKVADMLGVDPDFVVADDKVAIVRKQNQQAQAAQQAAAMVPEAARAAKDASQANTEGKNLLTDVMSRFSGYGATQ